MASHFSRLVSIYIFKISPLLPLQGEQKTVAQILGSELAQLYIIGMNRHHFQQWWALWLSWWWKSWGHSAKIMDSYGTKMIRERKEKEGIQALLISSTS